MRKLVYILALASVLSLQVAATQTLRRSTQPEPPQISVNLDREIIVANEPFQMTIRIESRSEGEPQVRLPSFGKLRVLRQSESHPMSFSFSFGTGRSRTQETRRQAVYTFVMVADEPGKYDLPPVVVQVDGKSFQGTKTVLKVNDTSGTSTSSIISPPASTSPMEPSKNDVRQAENERVLSAQELEGAKVESDFFVQTVVSKKKAVVGEPLVMTVYFYTAWRISNLDVVREPGTEGFWGENLLPDKRRLDYEKTVKIGDQVFSRTELRKLALFPIKPGRQILAPAVVEVETRSSGFFSRRKSVKRAAVPIYVNVDPLPPEGQPGSFDPANVGRYVFQAKVDRQEVKVGEPVTLELTVRGEGNLRNLSLPEIEEVDGFKTYDPETEVDVRVGGNSVSGVRSSKVLMIASEVGEHVIPPISWTFYDPGKGDYVTNRSAPISLNVLPSKLAISGGVAPSSAVNGQPKITGNDRLNRQLRSILSRKTVEMGSEFVLLEPWFLMVFFLAPGVYFAFVVTSRTRRRLERDKVRGRSKRADSEAIRKLKKLSETASDTASPQFFAELTRIITGFLEWRLQTAVVGDTMSELRNRLVLRGFKEQQADRVVCELEACDFARFARSADMPDERRLAIDRVQKIIRDLAGVRVLKSPGGQS